MLKVTAVASRHEAAVSIRIEEPAGTLVLVRASIGVEHSGEIAAEALAATAVGDEVSTVAQGGTEAEVWAGFAVVQAEVVVEPDVPRVVAVVVRAMAEAERVSSQVVPVAFEAGQVGYQDAPAAFAADRVARVEQASPRAGLDVLAESEADCQAG
jgi:hypothetical protein